MDSLDKLFGSPYRVKIMRIFLMNTDEVFTIEQIAKSSKISRTKVKREITLLGAVGFLKKGIRETPIIVSSSRGKKRIKKKREPGFQLSGLFPHIRALRALIVESASISRELLIKRFKTLGRGLKFVALSGVFIGDPSVGENGGLDLLVVGDNIRRSKLEKILGKIESEIGKELNYVLFDTNEFKYRQSMYDKFIMDILNSEHDVLVDTLKAGA